MRMSLKKDLEAFMESFDDLDGLKDIGSESLEDLWENNQVPSRASTSKGKTSQEENLSQRYSDSDQESDTQSTGSEINESLNLRGTSPTQSLEVLMEYLYGIDGLNGIGTEFWEYPRENNQVPCQASTSQGENLSQQYSDSDQASDTQSTGSEIKESLNLRGMPLKEKLEVQTKPFYILEEQVDIESESLEDFWENNQLPSLASTSQDETSWEEDLSQHYSDLEQESDTQSLVSEFKESLKLMRTSLKKDLGAVIEFFDNLDGLKDIESESWEGLWEITQVPSQASTSQGKTSQEENLSQRYSDSDQGSDTQSTGSEIKESLNLRGMPLKEKLEVQTKPFYILEEQVDIESESLEDFWENNQLPSLASTSQDETSWEEDLSQHYSDSEQENDTQSLVSEFKESLKLMRMSLKKDLEAVMEFFDDLDGLKDIESESWEGLWEITQVPSRASTSQEGNLPQQYSDSDQESDTQSTGSEIPESSNYRRMSSTEQIEVLRESFNDLEAERDIHIESWKEKRGSHLQQITLLSQKRHVTLPSTGGTFWEQQQKDSVESQQVEDKCQELSAILGLNIKQNVDLKKQIGHSQAWESEKKIMLSNLVEKKSSCKSLSDLVEEKAVKMLDIKQIRLEVSQKGNRHAAAECQPKLQEPRISLWKRFTRWFRKKMNSDANVPMES